MCNQDRDRQSCGGDESRHTANHTCSIVMSTTMFRQTAESSRAPMCVGFPLHPARLHTLVPGPSADTSLTRTLRNHDWSFESTVAQRRARIPHIGAENGGRCAIACKATHGCLPWRVSFLGATELAALLTGQSLRIPVRHRPIWYRCLLLRCRRVQDVERPVDRGHLRTWLPISKPRSPMAP
jgi:hypothetical protein